MPKHTKTTSIWPEPQILEAVGAKVRLVNCSQERKLIGRYEHLSQILPTEETSSFTSTPSLPNLPQPVKPKSSLPFSSSVSTDPDNILPEDLHVKFRQLFQTYDRIFDPDITGYNGDAGPILASVNIGPVQPPLPPQRKGRVPQYSRNQLVELQAKFDELERAQVFRRPEDLGVTAEYLNPSFLVRKPSGGHRRVTAFADVARYSKPQPSLMPDVETNPAHHCSLVLHDQNGSHPCLLPDPPLQVFSEVPRRSHTLRWNSHLHQISHGNAWVRDCA